MTTSKITDEILMIIFTLVIAYQMTFFKISNEISGEIIGEKVNNGISFHIRVAYSYKLCITNT